MYTLPIVVGVRDGTQATPEGVLRLCPRVILRCLLLRQLFVLGVHVGDHALHDLIEVDISCLVGFVAGLQTTVALSANAK